MTNYLITPSLLNSFQYYQKDEWKSPADSRADFLKTLSRERFAPNEAMQKGIDFEDDINRYCKGVEEGKIMQTINTFGGNGFCVDPTPYEKLLDQMSKFLIKGVWQESVKKEIEVGGKQFLLYGRTDVIKADTIIDIKYTGKYDLGKFSSSSQHRIYLYCAELPKFSYLVSNGKEWWSEDYINHEGIEGEIKAMISDLMGYLENDPEAKDLFLTEWKSK
ncbi:MAG: hypothetical protein ACJAW3_001326 [Lentimonas sp.]|jgi:hypothetical protein